MNASNGNLDGQCVAEPCIISDKSKDRVKRLISCNSPGCNGRFHAACIGHAKTSDRDLSNLFFVCSKCERFLNYNSEKAHKSFSKELENKLDALQKSMYSNVNEKITEANKKLLHQTKNLFGSSSYELETESEEETYTMNEGRCMGELCIMSDRSKDRVRRLIACNGPGCNERFHAACVGHTKTSDRDLRDLFFVCSKCEKYLNHSEETGRRSFALKLEKKLNTFQQSLFSTIDEKITEANRKFIHQTKALFCTFSTKFEDKVQEAKRQAKTANEFVLDLVKENDKKVAVLQSELHLLSHKYERDVGDIKAPCRTTPSQKMSYEWGYTNKNGPHTWARHFPNAAGENQSPILINTSVAKYDSNLVGNPISVNLDSECSLTVTNTGAGFHVDVGQQKLTLSGGPLDPSDTYQMAQFHFHWGSKDNWGSEHLLDGKAFPAEMHMVFWNSSQFPDLATAASTRNGLAVLGSLVTIGSLNEPMVPLVDVLENIHTKGSSSVTELVRISSLLPSDTEQYFTYKGSLTTPPCSESVTWIVFNNPISMSASQLEAFRSIKTGGEHSENIVDNFRPPCPLGTRQLNCSF